jgi:hypothetical protein
MSVAATFRLAGGLARRGIGHKTKRRGGQARRAKRNCFRLLAKKSYFPLSFLTLADKRDFTREAALR